MADSKTPWARHEESARKISSILSECCPAFIRNRDSSAGSEWHYCKCKAQNMNSCDCVWQHTDTCVAGTWLQLSFLNIKKQQDQKVSELALEQAKQACQS